MAKAKSDKKLTNTQRQARTYQIVFTIIVVVVLLTMILSLVK